MGALKAGKRLGVKFVLNVIEFHPVEQAVGVASNSSIGFAVNGIELPERCFDDWPVLLRIGLSDAIEHNPPFEAIQEPEHICAVAFGIGSIRSQPIDVSAAFSGR